MIYYRELEIKLISWIRNLKDSYVQKDEDINYILNKKLPSNSKVISNNNLLNELGLNPMDSTEAAEYQLMVFNSIEKLKSENIINCETFLENFNNAYYKDIELDEESICKKEILSKDELYKVNLECSDKIGRKLSEEEWNDIYKELIKHPEKIELHDERIYISSLDRRKLF